MLKFEELPELRARKSIFEHSHHTHPAPTHESATTIVWTTTNQNVNKKQQKTKQQQKKKKVY